MAITYRTVIKNAIDGFNNIQSKIYTYSGQLSAPSATDDTKISSIDEIVGALKEAGVTVIGSASSGSGTLSQLAPASGEAYTLATSAYSITSSQDTTDGSNYYIRLTAGGSGTVTPKVTTTAGLVKSATKSGSAVTASGSSTKYVKIPKAAGSVQSVAGTATYASLTGLTLSTSDKTSGITFTPKATSVSRRYKYTTAGYIPTNTTPGDNSGTLTGTAQYVTAVTVPAGKTLGSVTLTGGSSSARTYLSTLTVNGYTTISNMPVSGIITKLTNTGIVETMDGSNNRITTLGGTTNITNVGTSSEGATVNITTNTYGTINVWGTSAGDKMVRIANHTVTVDGTTVTNSSGDLTTTSLSSGTGAVSGTNVTLSDTNNGVAVTGSGTVSVGTGWISSTSKTSNGATKYISAISLPAGKTLGHYTSASDYADGITIDGASGSIGTLYAGFNTADYGDLYLRNAGATSYTKVATAGKLITDTPEFDGGGLSGGGLTQGAASGGGLTASGSGVELTDTNNGIAVTLSRAAFSQKVTRAAVSRAAVLYKGAVSGWVNVADNAEALPKNSSALASSSSTVSLAATSITKYISKLIIPAGKVLGHYTSSTDYADGVTINGASGSIGKLYAGFGNSSYGELYLRNAGATSYTKVGAAGKLVTATPKFDGGGLSKGSATGGGLTASDSNLDLSDTNNGISFTVSRAAFSQPVTRAAVLYNGAVNGWVNVADNTEARAADTTGTTVSLAADSITKYITKVTVPKDKPFTVAMTADTALDTTSKLSITNAAYRNVVVTNAANGTVTINGGNTDKGVLVNGANGKTVTVDGTTVTDANGDLKTASLNNATVSGATVTISTSGAGWIGSTSKSGTVPSGTISTSEATTSDAVPSGYTENTTAIVPTKGWLLIGAGYYPATAISLDTMLGGKDDGSTTAITAGYIRSGYKAYNVDGSLITGSMANWSPSSTYYTTTNTGFGAVTGYAYVNSATKYIIAGAHSASAGSDQSYKPTISKITTDGGNAGVNIHASTGTVTTTEPTSGYYVAVQSSGSSKTFTATSTVGTAGWIAKGSKTDSAVCTISSSDVTYVPVTAGVVSNGFVTTSGYIPTSTASYRTQYNATDDCVDILFN